MGVAKAKPWGELSVMIYQLWVIGYQLRVKSYQLAKNEKRLSGRTSEAYHL